MQLGPPNSDEQQEWELVRVLIEHGAKDYEGFANVADLVHQRTDPDLIESSLVKQVFDSYFNYLSVYNAVPEIPYFINYPDQSIQQRMASLLHTRNEMSPKWSENYGIETLHGELNYLNEVDSTLTYFELKKIKIVQVELLNRLKNEQDPNRLAALMRKQLELKHSEADILRRMGTVIVKQLGRG